MVYMIEKKYTNEDLEIELTSFLMQSRIFGSEEKMLLRSLDIRIRVMH